MSTQLNRSGLIPFDLERALRGDAVMSLKGEVAASFEKHRSVDHTYPYIVRYKDGWCNTTTKEGKQFVGEKSFRDLFMRDPAPTPATTTPTLHPFDLERAKRGDALVTRNGKQVTNFKKYNHSSYPYQATVDGSLESYTADGCYYHHKEANPRDLFMRNPASTTAPTPTPTLHPFDAQRALAGEEIVTRDGTPMTKFKRYDGIRYVYSAWHHKYGSMYYGAKGDYNADGPSSDYDLFMRHPAPPAASTHDWHNPENIPQTALGTNARFLLKSELETQFRKISVFMAYPEGWTLGEWDSSRANFHSWTYAVPRDTPFPDGTTLDAPTPTPVSSPTDDSIDALIMAAYPHTLTQIEQTNTQPQNTPMNTNTATPTTNQLPSVGSRWAYRLKNGTNSYECTIISVSSEGVLVKDKGRRRPEMLAMEHWINGAKTELITPPTRRERRAAKRFQRELANANQPTVNVTLRPSLLRGLRTRLFWAAVGTLTSAITMPAIKSAGVWVLSYVTTLLNR